MQKKVITISTPSYEIVTVNGKDYVIFYPQFLKDGDWATLGDENPLPINIIELDTLKDLTESLQETSEQNKEKLEQLNELISEMSMLSRGPKGDKGDPGPPNLEAQKDIDDHKQDKNNPHKVTKSQIGLSNVQNYGIALESQAKAGVSNAVYMTPLRTKQAIDEQRPVLIPRKTADVAGSEYPVGVSFMDIEGYGVSDGYPQNYGTVVTYKSADSRISQDFIGNGFNENQEDKWMRHYHPNNANNGWTEWVKILTEKDASGVEEIVRGENENGTYEKYPSGLMICRNSFGAPSNIEAGGIYRSESIRWDFPQEFIDDNVTVTVSPRSLNRWGGPTGAVSTDGTTIRIYSASSVTASYIVVVTAIGRWK